jgi:hypothetical protein
LGYLAIPGLWHYYWDDFTEAIAADLDGRKFLQDVKSEHKHHYAGTAPDDETYQIGRSKWGEDQSVFEAWKRDEWPSQRERIKSLMGETNGH